MGRVWLIGKDSDAGRDWWQEEKGTTEDEMAGWHHWLDGREFEVNSRSWWWTGRPGMLRFMVSQTVGHDWVTELNWMSITASLVAQMIKNPPAMRETWVWSLGWKDPLEEGTAIHSSILVWRILMDGGAWQATIQGVVKSRPPLSD